MNLRTTVIAFFLALLTVNPSLLAENEGQDKLDEATSKKLTAESPADLGKVIELCDEAIELGLDQGNLRLAKQILAASALQRAQLLVQQLPRMAANPNAMRELRRRTTSDLEKAIENNPKLADAFILLARVETLPGGSRENAIDHLSSAIELLDDKPVDQSRAYILRAVLQEDNEDKLADLAKAIEADSTNAQAWKERVALQMRMGKLQEAVEDAEKMLEADESNMFALEAAIQSLLGLQKTDEAIDLLTARIEKSPTQGVFYRVRARAYLIKENELVRDEGDQAEIDALGEMALSDLNKAIELDSRDFESLVIRGQIYYDQGEIEKANRDITDSLLIEPDSVQGVMMRSLVSAREGRYADAISDMEMLVRARPTNVDWVMQLASYYQMDDRPRLAISLLDELIRNNQDNWRAFRLRGDAKLSVSQHENAIEDYEEAVRILEVERQETPESPNSDVDYSGLLNNLSWVLSTSPNDDLRDGERAVELGLKACEATDYEAAHILSTLAAGYAELGDFENARKWAAKAVEVGSQDDGNDQLEQLKLELESYKKDQPWREEQNTQENDKPLSAASESIDT